MRNVSMVIDTIEVEESTPGSQLVARWFVENRLPAPYTARDLRDLARRIDEALAARGAV